MKIISENKILSICVFIFLLLFIGVQIGLINNPMVRNMIGMGIIGGGSVLLIVGPIYLVQKLWKLIKTKQ